MQKIRPFSFLSALILSGILIYSSCNKNDSKSATLSTAPKTGTLGSDALLQNHVRSSVDLPVGSSLLAKLSTSDVWKALPAPILSSIKKNELPQFQTYDNTAAQAIVFNIASDDPNLRYKSLIVATYKGSFLPIIAESKILPSGYTQVSITDVNGSDYLNFLVDPNNRFGKFRMVKDIPFDRLTGGTVSAPETAEVAATPTCMQSTSSFGACMKCAINECNSDWVCAVGCMVNAPGCAAAFALACGIGQM
ncbi:MAG TPA: hypothetical protein VL978_06995 [Puia sp.]|nr:hypothetical protein [Puia sp.]